MVRSFRRRASGIIVLSAFTKLESISKDLTVAAFILLIRWFDNRFEVIDSDLAQM